MFVPLLQRKGGLNLSPQDPEGSGREVWVSESFLMFVKRVWIGVFHGERWP